MRIVCKLLQFVIAVTVVAVARAAPLLPDSPAGNPAPGAQTPGTSQSTAPADAPPTDNRVLEESAAAALKQFLDAVRSGDGERIAGELDEHALAVHVFGEAYLARQPAADLQDAYPKFARHFADVLAMSQVLMHRVDPPQTVRTVGDEVTLDVKLTSAQGHSQTWRVLLVRRGERCKVADSGAAGAPSLCTLFGELYREQRPTGVTPAQFLATLGRAAPRPDGLQAQRTVPMRPTTTLTTAPAKPIERRPTTQFASAADAGRAYVDLLRAGHVEEAVDTFWDIDLMLHKIFAEEFAGMAEHDRLVSAQLVRRQLVRTFDKRSVFVTRSTIESLEARARSDDTTDVSVHLVTPAEEMRARFNLVKGGDGWKIFDERIAGNSQIDLIRRPYQPIHSHTTPLQWLIAIEAEDGAATAPPAGPVGPAGAPPGKR